MNHKTIITISKQEIKTIKQYQIRPLKSLATISTNIKIDERDIINQLVPKCHIHLLKQRCFETLLLAVSTIAQPMT